MTRTINFREVRWGHNIMSFNHDKKTCLAIVTPKPIVGDEIVWKTAYGEAYATLTDVEWLTDPSDMYKLTFDNIRRYVHEHLRSEIDSAPWEPDGWIA